MCIAENNINKNKLKNWKYTINASNGKPRPMKIHHQHRASLPSNGSFPLKWSKMETGKGQKRKRKQTMPTNHVKHSIFGWKMLTKTLIFAQAISTWGSFSSLEHLYRQRRVVNSNDSAELEPRIPSVRKRKKKKATNQKDGIVFDGHESHNTRWLWNFCNWFTKWRRDSRFLQKEIRFSDFAFWFFGGNVKTFVKFNGKMYTKARFGVKGVGSLGRWRCEDGLGD